MFASYIHVVLFIIAFHSVHQEKSLTSKQEARILEILSSDDKLLDMEFEKLGGFSSSAFPLYCRILDNPNEDRYIVVRTLSVLTQCKSDRSIFVDRAVSKLTHPHPGVRHTAVVLIGQIGSSRDAAPVVALLSDREWTIPFAAAKTLVAIGDQRTLVAMDVWMQSDVWKDDRQLREHVLICRNHLKARLDKEKQQKVNSLGK